MADANFILYNDDDVEVVNINGGYNLQCVQKVTVQPAQFSGVAGPNGKAAWLRNIPISGRRNPIVAIATSSSAQAGAAYFYDNNLYVGMDQSSGPPTAVVYVLDWNYPARGGTGNAGLELYDEAGRLIFTTQDPPVRIVNQLRMPWGDQSYPISVTPPSGRTYATIMLANLRQREVGSFNTTTGDIIANDFMIAAAGGLSGAACRAQQSGTGGYLAFVGSLPLPHGTPGGGPPGTSMGTIGGIGGCLVLDMTGI